METEITAARALYYEFFAFVFFFYEDDKKFFEWKKELEILQKSPLGDAQNFEILKSFDFERFKAEQNAVLFDFSISNVALSASFYDEGRDEGKMKIFVSNILKRSKFRRNEKEKNDEDFIGFIFYFMYVLLKNSETALSRELFSSVIDKIADKFSSALISHPNAVFFASIGKILRDFIELERTIKR